MNENIDDLTAINKIAADWNAGWDSGNVEALLALYVKRQDDHSWKIALLMDNSDEEA